jgi:hypothetical protein
MEIIKLALQKIQGILQADGVALYAMPGTGFPGTSNYFKIEIS